MAVAYRRTSERGGGVGKGNYSQATKLPRTTSKQFQRQLLPTSLKIPIAPMECGSPVHKLFGSFSATLGFLSTFSLLSNFQLIGQLLIFCVSIVTVMLLLHVKQLKSAEYG